MFDLAWKGLGAVRSQTLRIGLQKGFDGKLVAATLRVHLGPSWLAEHSSTDQSKGPLIERDMSKDTIQFLVGELRQHLLSSVPIPCIV